MRPSSGPLVFVLTLALTAIVVIVVMWYPLATRPLTHPGDDSIVEKAKVDARAVFHNADAHGRLTFPIVMRLAGQTCVELRSWAKDGAGTYMVCYDRRTGKKVEERAEAGF